MVENLVETTKICLHALPAREEAVIKRVVTFSGSQGRNYTISTLSEADILLVSDDNTVDRSQLNPAGCLIVRIADAQTEQPYDMLMQRPLLVTRVMRTLDEVKALVQSSQPATPVAPTKPLADSAKPAALPAADTVSTPREKEALVVPDPKPSVAAQIVSEAKPMTLAPSDEVESSEPESSELASSQPITEAEHDKNDQVGNSSDETTVADGDLQRGDQQGITAETATAGYHHLALVVDDSSAIRKQLELELRDAGIGADFAETGEEALQKVANHQYDLVFLDIIMPGIDGYETCQKMRLRRDMKKTPIIMLSAKTSPLDEVQGVIAGASTYLTKPVKSVQLQQTLKRVSMWLDNFQVNV